MRKSLTILLALLVAVSLILAACQPEPVEQEDTTN
jgi:ABC-type oligopeptide transport system substrate-binding subunit